MKRANIQLETLACPACLQKIEGAVKALDGVEKDSVNVMFNASRVRVDFDEEKISLEDIAEAIDIIGYEVLKSQAKDLEG